MKELSIMDVSQVTACVVDCGLFLNMARRLAQDCKRVLYWSPECRSWPSLRQAVIGDGFEGVESVREIWPHINEIDLFCFPDVQLPELQIYLRSQGYAVWGAGRGMDLELNREYFLEQLEKVGLNVPQFTVIEGITKLEDYLRDKTDQYIKISRFRGDMETQHWRNWAMDRDWIYSTALHMGPLGEKMRFIVCPAINADLEIGGDGYNIDGAWPSLMLNGVEGKDKSYFGAVTKREQMPAQIQEVMEAFAPLLAATQYRQQWSSEIRIQGEKAWFNDATQRGGMPSTGSQHLLWKNFSQIVWEGANGIMVDPEPAARFSIETMITAKRDPHTWETVEIPKELEGHALFNTCAYVDGAYVFPPSEYEGTDLGWLVATGDTPRETLERQKELADLLPDGLNADVEALADVIKAIDTGVEQGVPWGNNSPVPEPAEVL